jgi:TRAP-type C4-dicarboxylate transport system permease small subunit
LLRKISHLTDELIKFLNVVALGIILMTVLISIVLREFFGISFDSVIDINRLTFSWMVFLGTFLIYGNRSIIRFELFENHIPGRFKKGFELFNRLVCLALFIVMIFSGIQMSEYTLPQFFTTIKVSLFWLYIPITISGVLMSLKTVEMIIDIFRNSGSEKVKDNGGGQTTC